MEKLHDLEDLELSRIQLILRFDVILQHDLPLNNAFSILGFPLVGKRRGHVLIFSEITNTYRNHYSRSYENRSKTLFVS